MAGKKRREKPETGAAEAAKDEGAGMHPQLGRQMLMLPLLWMSGKVEWTEPRLQLLRTGFVSVMILGSLLVQWTMSIVARKKDTARLKEPGPGQYIDQAKAADGSVSIEEYDLAKLKEARTQLIMSAVLICGIHYKWGIVQPLLITSVMMPLQLWDCKALAIHLLGQKHARPWAAAGANNPLSQWVVRQKAEAAQAEAAQAERKESLKQE